MSRRGQFKATDFILAGAMGIALLVAVGAIAVAWRTAALQPIEELVPERRLGTMQLEDLVDQAAVAKAPELERAVDRFVMSQFGVALPSESVVDAAPDAPYRVDLSRQGLANMPGRVTVDLDRDGRWDEVWEIGDGLVRSVSPNDDETYTDTYTMGAAGWVQQGVQAEGSAPEAVVADPARKLIDDTVWAWHGRDLGVAVIRDASKGFDFRLELHQDEGSGVLSRVRLDLDRDDRFDEQWALGDGGVVREVSPEDNEAYSERYRWNGATWDPL